MEHYKKLVRDLGNSARIIPQKTAYRDCCSLPASITDNTPESGGGGESAKEGNNEAPSAGSDDDSGDGDSDPEPARRKRHPSSSSKRCNVTATADALLWTMPTICKSIGLSRSNIYQKIQNGAFPEPIKLGRSSRWLASEIFEWVNTQACARSPKTAG